MSATSSSSDPTPQQEPIARARSSIRALSAVLPSLPDSLLSSETPAQSLLHDPDVGRHVSALLRNPASGAGNDNICRWLYDTFQTADAQLHLVVLRFVPAVAGVYLSRAVARVPLAGFEAVLLAIYSHETKARGGQPQIVNIPNVEHGPSLYHETAKSQGKNRAIDLHLAVVSPALEPHGTVRATKRARIVGVALELYFSKICHMPVYSKLEFCEFCVAWAGQEGCDDADTEQQRQHEEAQEEEEKRGGGEEGGVGEEDNGGGRIPLPWELFQPVVRIVGHCLLGPGGSEKLKGAALAAARCLYARAVHDMEPQAILATRSLLRSRKMAMDDTDLGALEDLREIRVPDQADPMPETTTM